MYTLLSSSMASATIAKSACDAKDHKKKKGGHGGGGKDCDDNNHHGGGGGGGDVWDWIKKWLSGWRP
jgi:hypothetical protein